MAWGKGNSNSRGTGSKMQKPPAATRNKPQPSSRQAPVGERKRMSNGRQGKKK